MIHGNERPQIGVATGLTLITLLLAGCGGGTSPNCDPDTIQSSFVGQWTYLGQQVGLNWVGTQDTATIGLQAFSDLHAVLGAGESALPGSVVWDMQHPTGTGLLLIQLAGSRTVGMSLPVIGVTTAGLPWGKAGAISAIVPDGAIVLFFTDTFSATAGTGTLLVRSTQPFRASLDVNMASQAGPAGHLLGEVGVTFFVARPGC